MADRLTQKIYLEKAPAWVHAHAAWLTERVPEVQSAGYTLRDLVRRAALEESAVDIFLQDTGLADFGWRMLWAGEDEKDRTETLDRIVRSADGIVVFVHGWTGSGKIWEDLPALVVKQNPYLIALVPDINGFGKTPFKDSDPPPNKVDPPATMAALERWLAVIGLHRQVPVERRRPFVFVGHSMGGATLFYASRKYWEKIELGRIALAPSLWMNDPSRQRLYRTMGAAVKIGRWNEFTDWVAENVFVPRVIESLTGNSSKQVQAEHQRMYRETPEKVVSNVLAALGALEAKFDQTEWSNFKVMLANRDAMVGIQPTLDLLEQIGFDPAHIEVAFGEHYFFSIGAEEKKHRANRDRVVQMILAMHDTLAAGIQRKATIVTPLPPPPVKKPVIDPSRDPHKMDTRRLNREQLQAEEQKRTQKTARAADNESMPPSADGKH